MKMFSKFIFGRTAALIWLVTNRFMPKIYRRKAPYELAIQQHVIFIGVQNGKFGMSTKCKETTDIHDAELKNNDRIAAGSIFEY